MSLEVKEGLEFPQACTRDRRKTINYCQFSLAHIMSFSYSQRSCLCHSDALSYSYTHTHFLSLSLLLPLSHTQQKLNDKKCFSWIKMKFVLKLHFILFVATHFLSCDCYDSANRPGWSREVPWSPAYGPPPT